jgi:protein Tex
MDLISYVQSHTSASKASINNIIQMVAEGASIPFMARYRKERTGSMDEVMLASVIKSHDNFLEIQKRKTSIIESISEQGKLTPDLESKINSCYELHALEDLYLPYKKRKKTRADIARENGLEGLAKLIMTQSNFDVNETAKKYLNDKVILIQDAINGAKDIIAECVNENINTREYLRVYLRTNGDISSKVIGTKKTEATTYQDYFDFHEAIKKIPSHRFLAILRGSNEGLLRISIKVDDEYIKHKINASYVKQNNKAGQLVKEAIDDAYDRLLFPSIENQVFNEVKEIADKEATQVFTQNLKQLLIAPPLGEKATIAIDPGFRTGCKLAVLSPQGSLLEYTTIFPTPPQSDTIAASHTLRTLIEKHQVSAIAIGNGTASRETESFVKDTTKGLYYPVDVYVVSESGASIYSASEVGREEFPKLDATVRGSISIGRRLMDPLAELVKIDAKSIGVGQYQHDVNQVLLKESLDQTVESVVNSVGVNLNTASPHLLQYISGLGLGLATKIVEIRSEQGPFKSKDDLKKVPRLGPKAFEQCSGFLRIREGVHPLDNTGVHPEAYPVVKKMAKDLGITLENLIKDKSQIAKIKISQYVDDQFGIPTLEDIIKELQKPGHDPRGEAKPFSFDDTVRTIDDIKPGMILNGIIGNMTNFGAFVDIGIKENGLIHISQITNKFIRSAGEALTLGQHITAKVIEVDVPRKRISLTLKF